MASYSVTAVRTVDDSVYPAMVEFELVDAHSVVHRFWDKTAVIGAVEPLPDYPFQFPLEVDAEEGDGPTVWITTRWDTSTVSYSADGAHLVEGLNRFEVYRAEIDLKIADP